MRTCIPRPPRWRAPFLRTLTKTGNVKLSAERAPVHFSHVYRLRKKDAEFASAVDAARAEAAERLGDSPSPSLTKCTGDAVRGELVLFRTRTGRLHLRAPRANGWTRAKEKDFLDALASNCVVTTAASIAGVTPSAAYQRRLRWPAFAAEWKVALKNGNSGTRPAAATRCRRVYGKRLCRGARGLHRNERGRCNPCARLPQKTDGYAAARLERNAGRCRSGQGADYTPDTGAGR